MSTIFVFTRMQCNFSAIDDNYCKSVNLLLVSKAKVLVIQVFNHYIVFRNVDNKVETSSIGKEIYFFKRYLHLWFN